MEVAAQDMSIVMSYLPWFAMAVIGALAVGLFLAMSAMRQLQSDLDNVSLQATRAEQVLAQATDGALIIVHDADGAQLDDSAVTCSRRLAVMLSLAQGESAEYKDVVAALSPSSAKELHQAIQGLMQLGDAFDLLVEAPGAGRLLQASGVRADEFAGDKTTSVVWFTDVSKEMERHATLTRELETLQHDRSRYRAALDAVPVPIWLRDDDLSMSFCNNAYAQVVGAETPLQARQRHLEIIKGADGREGRALAASARAAGAERSAQEVVPLGGVLHHYMVMETPLYPHGASAVMEEEIPELRGTVGIALDVSEQHSAEANLTRHEEAHATVLERLGTAMAVFGSDQRLQFYNTAFAHLWQLDSGWLDSEPDFATVLEVLRDRRQLPEVADFPAYKAQELAAFTDLLEPIEGLMHLPGGATLRRLVAPHPLGGLLLTYEDVTDTLALERSYNTLIDVQAETLNHLQEAVAVFDGAGILRLSNAAFANLWDLPEVRPQPGGADASGQAMRFREVVDLQALQLGDGLPRDAFVTQMAQILQQRELQTGTLPHKGVGVVQWQAAPVADGGLVLSYACMRSVADDGIGAQSIASLVTDVVRSIAGWGDVLVHGHYGGMNQRQQAYVDSIRDGAAALDRVLTAVDEIPQLSDATTFVTEAVDVHVILSRALAEARPRVQRRGVNLYFDCLPDIGSHRMIRASFQRLLELILDMAIDSTSASDSITLAAQRENGGGLLLTIADTGAGWDVQAGTDEDRAGASDHGADARFTVIKTYAAQQDWRFELVTVPGEGTTVSLSCDRQ